MADAVGTVSQLTLARRLQHKTRVKYGTVTLADNVALVCRLQASSPWMQWLGEWAMAIVKWLQGLVRDMLVMAMPAVGRA
jgi:hypothetical protein